MSLDERRIISFCLLFSHTVTMRLLGLSILGKGVGESGRGHPSTKYLPFGTFSI
jgi:hypothetical protein